jgi:hypothetical protein
LKKFHFIDFPEQIFHFKNNKENFIPVLPIFKELSDFNRIISALKRWGDDFAVFFDRKSYSLKQFLESAKEFPNIFVEDPDIAIALRDVGFDGGIYLFSNFRQLNYPGFFKELDVIPVVTGKNNYMKAKDIGVPSVYIVSDKICVADIGLCISRKGIMQCFYNCDNRCRERSLAKAGLKFPVSIRPETTHPEDSDVLIYSENIFYPSITEGGVREQILESYWNYRYPIGKEILHSGTRGQGKIFHFSIDKKIEDALNKGLVGFYGYKGSMYKGNWVDPVNVPKVKNGKITVNLQEGFEELLLVIRYSERELDFMKKGRHFIYTLPEKKVLHEPVKDTYQVQPVNRGAGRFSNRSKITLIADDSARFSSFKGKHVEKKVLVYRKANVGKYFSDYILLDGNITDKEIEEISQLPRLRGIVVRDSLLKIYLESVFPQKDILLHPLSYSVSENAPSFLSASTTVFTSNYKTDKKRDFGWNDINIYLKNRKSGIDFISKKKLFKKGGKKELWVDISEINDKALIFLKVQAENFIRSGG